jgi:peroxisomal enoyl-CoA hydratase 2
MIAADLYTAYKGTSQEIVDFRTLGKPTDISGIPGIPQFDRNKVVDGEKHIKILRDLPTCSGPRKFILRQKLVGIYDKGKAGSVIETSTDLLDSESGDIYTTISGSVFAVGQGNWGGPKGQLLLELLETDLPSDILLRTQTDELHSPTGPST